jgi:hypothetical protein
MAEDAARDNEDPRPLLTLLALSIAVLWTAPWLYAAAARTPRLRAAVERILAVSVAVLVVFNVLPDALRALGLWAIAVAAVGMALPSVLERLFRRAAEQVHWIPLSLAVFGLALHASLDGAAFVGGTASSGSALHVHALPLGIVVHRFFEGLFLWWTLRPRAGVRGAVLALGFVTLFSVVGYFAGDAWFHRVEAATAFGVLQAIVAGSLLHVVVDRHGAGHGHHHGHDPVHAHSHRHEHPH